jgi:hypothetical protein
MTNPIQAKIIQSIRLGGLNKIIVEVVPNDIAFFLWLRKNAGVINGMSIR